MGYVCSEAYSTRRYLLSRRSYPSSGKETRFIASFDLSDATDRWPVPVIYELMACLFDHEHINDQTYYSIGLVSVVSHNLELNSQEQIPCQQKIE
ncbi:hypothetical protein Bca4012_047526 [Brassica carinata]